MNEYVIEWSIDVTAETPQQAAEQAWDHMTRHGATATMFEVFPEDGSSSSQIYVDYHARTVETTRARVTINPADVAEKLPESWDDEQVAEWLADNRQQIQDDMLQRAWDSIDTLAKMTAGD